MTKVVSSADVQKNFGAYRELAQGEPVVVQHYGAPSVVVLSISEYDRLRSLDRQILSLDDLSDSDLDDIAQAEIPPEYRYTSEQLPESD